MLDNRGDGDTRDVISGMYNVHICRELGARTRWVARMKFLTNLFVKFLKNRTLHSTTQTYGVATNVPRK